MSPRVALIALAAVLAAAVLAGCGLEGQPFDNSGSTTSTTQLGYAVVTRDEIAGYPSNSPEAAVLRWWRAVQTRDPEAVLKSYTPEVRDALPKDFAKAMVAFVGPPASQGAIWIDYVESSGEDKATVYAGIDGSPDPRMDGPLALRMVKDGDRWLIADGTFVEVLTAGVAVKGQDQPASGPGAGGS